MKFSYNPRILRHLGTELITSDEIAITELLKNCYDAKATKVTIQFLSSFNELDKNTLETGVVKGVSEILGQQESHGLILIEDNGVGMNYDRLKKGFFEIGTEIKIKEKKEQVSNNEETEAQPEENDIILGDKGIGRLSAQRLSPLLFVETTSDDEEDIILVKILWSDFIQKKDADAPEWKFPKKTKKISYTRLWLFGTKGHDLALDKYAREEEQSQLDLFGKPTKLTKILSVTPGLQTALGFLYSPFVKRKSLIELIILLNNKNVKLDFNYDTIKIAESIHSFSSEIIKDEDGKVVDMILSLSMEIQPWFLERIHQTEIGKVLYQDWKLSHKQYKELQIKYKDHYLSSLFEEIKLSDLIATKKWNANYLQSILDISPLEGKIYSFKRDSVLMRNAIDSALDNDVIGKRADIKGDIKPFLDAHNGIKLYRNKFRIGTIGNKDNDWLQLQQKRTSGQQFYRFELGNVIGFIKVNDFYQRYIYETSSREHLTDNLHVKALQDVLDYIIEAFSPRFTKRAVEITKNILDLEGIIPRNDPNDIKSEVRKSEEILNAAKQNIKAIEKAFNVINENIDLDTDDKRAAVQNVLLGLQSITQGFQENIDETNRSFAAATKLIKIAESEQKRIEVEAYNNYKLMANGLVTEVITHELHSMLSSESASEQNEVHFAEVKNYLFKEKQYELNKLHLDPIHDKFEFLHLKMNELNRFYSFLEKTFIYRGNSHDFEEVNISQYLQDLEFRFKPRLKKHKINIDYSGVDGTWFIPKGSLMHIFYNLIDNAIYWIEERQKISRHDKLYSIQEDDEIIIRKINNQTLHFFDSGTGVLDRLQHTLFNPLESGKENGRGMGLYIIRNFLKSFGGEIELLPVRNKYNNRYIFELRLKNNSSENDQA